MTARLVALVMLPVTIICGLVVSQVVLRGSTASAALEVDGGVVELSALVELHGAVESQRVLAAFIDRVSELGVSRELASDMVGMDLQVAADRARARADRALGSLGPASPVTHSAVEALFAYPADELWVPSAPERYDELEAPIVAALTERLATVEDATRRTNNDSLLVALDSLRLVDRMSDAAAPQGVELSALFAAEPPEDTPAIVARLGAATATYGNAVGRITELGSPAVVAALRSIAEDPRVAAFDAAVDQALAGEPVRPAGGDARASASEVFHGYTLRADMIEEVVGTATRTVREGAQELAAAERRAFFAWAGLASVLVLGTVAIAVACARSIARPLRDLARYAHEVNEGNLDADPAKAGTRGPREIRVAASAFTDLVDSLQLLDAKANALALCAFDDPVLDQPLPGRLGRSLESSVAVLSSSIVERDRLQSHLSHQATHDALTGIPNRTAAVTAIAEAMARGRRRGETVAVLFVDLNAFKSVNDRFGHDAGDEVLRVVALRLRHELREHDLVARLGGDEFVVVAEGVGDGEGATELGRRIIGALDQPIEVDGGSVVVGASVGIALTRDGLDDPQDLLARADAAMYRAKSRDRSALVVFDAELERQVLEREDIARGLAEALAAPDGGGLALRFQPVLLAEDNRLASLEALIRWDRPGHGWVPPDVFVPIAETSSLIIDLDRWVLDAATRQLAAWADDPDLGGVPVAINISGRHLDSGRLPHHIGEALHRAAIDPGRLTIELTETVLLDDLEAAAAELDAVRRLGIRVAIDDFGTGYTSVAHLQHLPIDTIKIDRSFTSQVNTGRGRSLVRMVTDVGHAIDLSIVAEGVETADELETLRTLGADQVQGFLFSRPLPEADLRAWVRGRAGWMITSA